MSSENFMLSWVWKRCIALSKLEKNKNTVQKTTKRCKVTKKAKIRNQVPHMQATYSYIQYSLVRVVIIFKHASAASISSCDRYLNLIYALIYIPAIFLWNLVRANSWRLVCVFDARICNKYRISRQVVFALSWGKYNGTLNSSSCEMFYRD